MMRRLFILCAMVMSVCVCGESRGGRPTFRPADAEYVYEGSCGEKQPMVVYYPEGWTDGTDFPGVLLFHGGGWSHGDLTAFQYFCDYLSSRGMVAISANYKLCPKEMRSELPDGVSHKRWAVMDAKSCVRWVKSHAEMLHVDPDRLVLGGGSAGGHIATLALLDDEFNNEADPETSVSAEALLLFNPAYTIPANDPVQDVNVFIKLKPVLPPAIIFYGSEDGWKLSNFDRLRPKLTEQGAEFKEWVAPGQGHGFFNKFPWCDVVLKKVDEFLVDRGFLHGISPLSDPGSGEYLVISDSENKSKSNSK